MRCPHCDRGIRRSRLDRCNARCVQRGRKKKRQDWIAASWAEIQGKIPLTSRKMSGTVYVGNQMEEKKSLSGSNSRRE
jgi:hypothetical protein